MRDSSFYQVLSLRINLAILFEVSWLELSITEYALCSISVGLAPASQGYARSNLVGGFGIPPIREVLNRNCRHM